MTLIYTAHPDKFNNYYYYYYYISTFAIFDLCRSRPFLTWVVIRNTRSARLHSDIVKVLYIMNRTIQKAGLNSLMKWQSVRKLSTVQKNQEGHPLLFFFDFICLVKT